MTKRAFVAVVGFLSLCLAVSAQQAQRLGQFQSDGSTLNRSVLQLPSLTLADRQLFSFANSINWIEATPSEFLPPLSAQEPARVHPVARSVRDSEDKVVEMRPRLFDYAGGEVGVLYGRSTGKYGGSLEQGWILGEVGNDKIHITAGAFYQESSGRGPRFGR